MVRQPSLTTEVKQQVTARLKAAYPAFFKKFSIKTRRYARGGDVDIEWLDGPSQDKVDTLLRSFHSADSVVSIMTQRRYSVRFLRKVAFEYCLSKRCDVPMFAPLGDDAVQIDWREDVDLKVAIMKKCRLLAEEELEDLAYRLYPAYKGDVCTMMPVRAWIVRRQDFSRGRYPAVAIIRENSYTSYELKLSYVRERINENWVKVVHLDSLSHMDNVYRLDQYVELCKCCGRPINDDLLRLVAEEKAREKQIHNPLSGMAPVILLRKA